MDKRVENKLVCMNRRITFAAAAAAAAAAVAVVAGALFAQEAIVRTNILDRTTELSLSPIVLPGDMTDYSASGVWIYGTNILVRGVLSVDEVVSELRKQGDMTNLVQKLVKSGDVCAVVGHQWENIPHLTLEYRTSGEYPAHRICRLCSKCETKEPGEWK
jgi:hypothetical protein